MLQICPINKCLRSSNLQLTNYFNPLPPHSFYAFFFFFFYVLYFLYWLCTLYVSSCFFALVLFSSVFCATGRLLATFCVCLCLASPHLHSLPTEMPVPGSFQGIGAPCARSSSSNYPARIVRLG